MTLSVGFCFLVAAGFFYVSRGAGKDGNLETAFKAQLAGGMIYLYAVYKILVDLGFLG